MWGRGISMGQRTHNVGQRNLYGAEDPQCGAEELLWDRGPPMWGRGHAMGQRTLSVGQRSLYGAEDPQCGAEDPLWG